MLARDVLPVADAAAKIERRGRTVVLGQLEPEDLATYEPIAAVQLPSAPAYLAADVDLGAASRNVAPEDALRDILAAGRSPLTLDEGIAPAAAARGDRAQLGFSVSARRGDQRVPAFWISRAGRSSAGAGIATRTLWLGTASCASRAAQPTMSVPPCRRPCGRPPGSRTRTCRASGAR